MIATAPVLYAQRRASLQIRSMHTWCQFRKALMCHPADGKRQKIHMLLVKTLGLRDQHIQVKHCGPQAEKCRAAEAGSRDCMEHLKADSLRLRC